MSDAARLAQLESENTRLRARVEWLERDRRWLTIVLIMTASAALWIAL